MFRLDPAIGAYYDRVPEESRLELGPFRLEALRTREPVLRHAPGPPVDALDIGGAAGAYAFWLAELGYAVQLVDAAPRLIQVARTRNAEATHQLKSCAVADARALPHPNASADMVLLLGPLYHLVEADDRRQALAEAHRVLRDNGVLISAGMGVRARRLEP